MIQGIKQWACVTEHADLFLNLQAQWAQQLNFQFHLFDSKQSYFESAVYDVDIQFIDVKQFVDRMLCEQHICDVIQSYSYSMDIKMGKRVKTILILDDDHIHVQLNDLLSCDTHVLGVVHVKDLTDTANSVQVLVNALSHVKFVSNHVWGKSPCISNVSQTHIVNNNISSALTQVWNSKFCNDIPIHMHAHKSLSKFITQMWHAPKVVVDVICVHANMLQHVPNTNVLDIVHMIQTANHIYQMGTGNKPAKIYVDVDDQTDLNMIKQVLSISGLNGVTQLTNCDYVCTQASLQAMSQGVFHVPHTIKAQLDKNKISHKQVKKDTLSLTPREQQILDIVCEKGNSNKMIANDLKLSESAVKLHIGNILKKHNVRNRTELAIKVKNTQSV